VLTRNYKRNLEKFVEKYWPGAIRKEAHGGSEFRFLCPFCHGGRSKELSFDLNVKKGTAQCWRAKCGWRGTSNWFLSQFLNISPKEAYDLLSGEIEISVDTLIGEIEELKLSLARRFDLPTENEFKSLDGFWRSCEFLSESDIEDEVFDWIENVRKYDTEEFFQCHTLLKPPPLDDWEGYVVFEVETNDMIAYQLYAFRPGVMPKTRNPKGDVLHLFLYNYNSVKFGEFPVFVCEGIFDAARLISWGYQAVCTFGTNMSEYQAYLLSRIQSSEIVLCYDNGAEDKAKTAIKLLNQHCYEKELTRMFLDIEDIDPDKLTEDQFLNFYNKRTRYVKEIDKMKRKLLSAKNKWN